MDAPRSYPPLLARFWRWLALGVDISCSQKPQRTRSCTEEAWLFYLYPTLLRMGHRQAVGYDRVCCGIEGHADVGPWDFKVRALLLGEAVAPIYDAVVTRVNGGLEHGTRNFAAERVNEVASALSGVATREHRTAVLELNLQADCFGSMKNRAIRHRALDGRGERSYGRDVARPLSCQGTG